MNAVLELNLAVIYLVAALLTTAVVFACMPRIAEAYDRSVNTLQRGVARYQRQAIDGDDKAARLAESRHDLKFRNRHAAATLRALAGTERGLLVSSRPGWCGRSQ